MIEIKNLEKSFGKNKVLDALNLKIERGKVYGILGRNGVGKTTLLNIIGARIKKFKGSIELDGESIYENSKALEKIGLIRETGFGVDNLKAGEIIEAGKTLYKNWNEEKYTRLVEEFDFGKNLKKHYSKLSRGNKTILGIIIGLASDTDFLFLDEPNIGLDAVYREKFDQAIFREIDRGERAVIIATHLIDEFSKLFEEVIILDQAGLVLQESLYTIGEKSHIIKGFEKDCMKILEGKNILDIERFGNSLIVSLFDNLTGEERSFLEERGVEIEKMGLQKLFVQLTS